MSNTITPDAARTLHTAMVEEEKKRIAAEHRLDEIYEKLRPFILSCGKFNLTDTFNSVEETVVRFAWEFKRERDAAKASEAEALRQMNEWDHEEGVKMKNLRDANKRLVADLADALKRLEIAEQHLSSTSRN